MSRNRDFEAERCKTNVLQCLSEKRDATISFRLPSWMKQQIKKSGKSNADFIIAELAKTMFRELEYNKEDWDEEIKEF